MTATQKTQWLRKARQHLRRLTAGPRDEHLYPATLEQREREYKIRLAAFLAGHQPKIRVIKA